MFTKEWSQEELDFLKNNYLKMSNKEISQNINRTNKAIQVKLSKMGLKRPDKYYYNKHFFQDINTEEKAYWLGFMYADGYVCCSKTNAEVAIELSAIDIDHLRKFNKSLGGNISPTIRKERKKCLKTTYGIASFRIYSKEMAQDLIAHGCIQRKTFYIKFPKFENKFLTWSFIRGFFDGDGSVYRDTKRKFIGFNFTSASKDFLKELQKFLYEEGIYAYLSQEKREKSNLNITAPTYKIFITGLNNAYEFGKKLYSEANIFLDRKKIKYDEAIKEYNVEERTRNRPYRR